MSRGRKGGRIHTRRQAQLRYFFWGGRKGTLAANEYQEHPNSNFDSHNSSSMHGLPATGSPGCQSRKALDSHWTFLPIESRGFKGKGDEDFSKLTIRFLDQGFEQHPTTKPRRLYCKCYCLVVWVAVVLCPRRDPGPKRPRSARPRGSH